MWKPGQIVTIRGIVCRVIKATESRFVICESICEFRQLLCSEYPCSNCCGIDGKKKLPSNCYLKKI